MKRTLVIFLLVFGFLSTYSMAEEKRFASWYLINGKSDLDKGLNISAIIDLKSALHINPNLVLAYRYLGQAYSNMYLWEQAAREYNKILFFSPSRSERREILNKIYEWEDKKDYLTATARYSYYVIMYRDKVWEEPSNFLSYLALAEVYECQGEYDKTEGFYRYLSDQYPDKMVFRLYLAEVLSLAGKPDEAERIYTEILKQEPLNMEANLGLNFILKKRYEDQLRHDREDLAAHIGLGRALGGLKRYEKAIDEYKYVLERDYVNADVRIDLAEAYESLGRYEDAINEYRLLNRLDPKAVKYLLRAASIYEKLGSIEDARDTYEKIYAVDPDNEEVKLALRRLNISRRIDLYAMSDEQFGKAGLKDSVMKGWRAMFYAPFNLTTRAIYGYSKYALTLAGPINRDLYAYTVGVEKDLPLNYRAHAIFINTRCDALMRSNNDYDIGISRIFMDGGYFEAALAKCDINDNVNTVNNNMTEERIRLRTFNPLSDRWLAAAEGSYINYSDVNSGIELKAQCYYVITEAPACMSLVGDTSYSNTSITTGRPYWTPKDDYEFRIGMVLEYSFDEQNYYLVDYRVGRDMDFIESSELVLEIGHNIGDWLRICVRGDGRNSKDYRTNNYLGAITLVF